MISQAATRRQADLRAGRRRRTQQVGFVVLAAATTITVIPIVLIVALVLVRGLAAITPGFLLTFPSDGMPRRRDSPGHCWHLLAHHWDGGGSCSFGNRRRHLPGRICSRQSLDSVDPRRHHQSCRHPFRCVWPFRPGIVCPILALRYQHPGGLPDAGDHDSARCHIHNRRGSTGHPQQLQGCQYLPRGNPLADGAAHRPSTGIIWDHDRRHPWTGTSCRRNGPDLVHRRSLLLAYAA